MDLPIKIVETHEVVELLDRVRERYNISSDEKLAKILGVSDQAIYRWRRGQFNKSTRVILSLERQLQSPPS